MPAFAFGSALALGGAGADYGIDIALDAAGSVYVSGMYAGTVDFDPNHTNPASSHVLSAAAAFDNFAAKYLADGTFQWAVDLGTNAQGGPGETIAVEGSNVYVTAIGDAGETNVARLDAGTGAVAWVTNLTGGGSSFRAGVAAGPGGSVYVSGRNGPSQAFVAKLDAAGAVVWTAASVGGTASAASVAVDGGGNVYAIGSYTGAVTFGATALTSWSGTQDVYVWKLNAAGGTVWAGGFGSNGFDYGKDITLDASGRVFVTGSWGNSSSNASQNNNFNPNPGGAVKLTNNGGFDVYVAKLAPGANGSLVLNWAKSFGGTGLDYGEGVAVDGAGAVYATGGFAGTVNFNPNKGKAFSLAGGGVYVSKLDAGGNFLTAAGIGSSSNNGRAIAVDASGNVYTTGVFSGTADFNPSAGTYTLTSNGSVDAFVSKLMQSGAGALANPAGGESPRLGGRDVAPNRVAPDAGRAATAGGVDWLAAAGLRRRRWLTDDASAFDAPLP